MLRTALALLAMLSLGGSAVAADDSDRPEARERMIREIRSMAAAADAGPIDERVLDALARVPRHRFVPAPMQRRAYENRPLPIGHDQTISQPFIVAWMTDLLDPAPGDTVLEVGTGSGYQAAILSLLVARVYSIEIVAPLAEASAERLRALGYANVTVREGDGYAGWPGHAPFDAIIVTAGAEHVPQPLVDQLKPGGRMVIPVGRQSTGQEMVLIEKAADGRIRRRSLGAVRFVPLTGDHR